MGWLSGFIDGSWIDIGSAVCAIGAGNARARRPNADRNKVIVDFLNGATLFPFLVMMTVVFASHVLRAIADSSKASLFLAGGVGVVGWWLSCARPDQGRRRSENDRCVQPAG